jgi:hypothetical protein
MGELSFLTIIVSLAVCSILVFAVYQYMKVRFTVLEHSQKEQALILQQYIEESSYDIQGLQSIVFRQRGGAGVQQQQEHQAQMDASEPEEVYEDHNKHIHMDTVMYEAPNKPRSTLIAISSDSENTTSDEDEDGESSNSGSSSGSSSDGSESDGSESDGSDDSDSEDSEIESENVHMIHDIHEVKHIEISSTLDDHDHHHDNELEIESVTIIDEEPALALEPALEPAPDTKTITIDLGTSVDTDEHQLASMTESYDASASSSVAASSASSSVSFHGLSVIELRALLKEKYKGQPDKITNLQKLKKPELIQLLHE